MLNRRMSVNDMRLCPVVVVWIVPWIIYFKLKLLLFNYASE